MYVTVWLTVLGVALVAVSLRLPPFGLRGQAWGKGLAVAAVVNLWLAAMLGFKTEFYPLLPAYFWLINCLYLAVLTDIKSHEVYDLHFYALLVGGAVSAFWQPSVKFWLLYLSFLLLLAVLSIVAARRADLGMGDARMIACMALYFPFTRWLEVMLMALGLAMLYGLFGVLTKRKTMQTAFAFMPFLLLGVLLEFM